jgi:hypothetical protein
MCLISKLRQIQYPARTTITIGNITIGKWVDGFELMTIYVDGIDIS